VSSAFPLHELRALLAASHPETGVVVAVEASRVEVATASGLLQAFAPGRVPDIGERVTLRDGVAYPRAAPTRRYVL
jgi:hypothetical protein